MKPPSTAVSSRVGLGGCGEGGQSGCVLDQNHAMSGAGFGVFVVLVSVASRTPPRANVAMASRYLPFIGPFCCCFSLVVTVPHANGFINESNEYGKPPCHLTNQLFAIVFRGASRD